VGFRFNHHISTTQKQQKHKNGATGDLRVITIVIIAAAKRIASGIRALGIRMSTYKAAIDHKDNTAMATQLRLSAITLITRSQTGRVAGACTLMLSKGPPSFYPSRCSSLVDILFRASAGVYWQNYLLMSSLWRPIF
jgi:hypothetical protein